MVLNIRSRSGSPRQPRTPTPELIGQTARCNKIPLEIWTVHTYCIITRVSAPSQASHLTSPRKNKESRFQSISPDSSAGAASHRTPLLYPIRTLMDDWEPPTPSTKSARSIINHFLHQLALPPFVFALAFALSQTEQPKEVSCRTQSRAWVSLAEEFTEELHPRLPTMPPADEL